MMALSETKKFTFDTESTTTYLGETNKGTFIYTAVNSEKFSIGSTSHGGFSMSLLMDAAMQHFSKREQKHPVALNCFFLSITRPGHSLVELEEIKMSATGYCVIRITLKQRKDFQPLASIENYHPSDWKEKVLGIATMGNFDTEKGIDFRPHQPRPLHKTHPFTPLNTNFVGKVVAHEISVVPKGPYNDLPVIRHLGWHKDDEPLSFKSMPFWADMVAPPPLFLPEDVRDKTLGGPLWFPTMQFEILFKSKPRGRKLYSEFVAHNCLNGRADIDGELWNEYGEILAVAKQQCLAVPWTRNSKDIEMMSRESSI